MNFLISDTFTDSLARLTGDEQKAAKTTAFDLQMNPAGNGLSFHKLDKAKDKNFWSPTPWPTPFTPSSSDFSAANPASASASTSILSNP